MKKWVVAGVASGTAFLVAGVGYWQMSQGLESRGIPQEQVVRYIKGDRQGIPKGRLKLFKKVRAEVNEDFQDPESTVLKIQQLQGKEPDQLTREEQIYVYMSEAMITESLESFGEVLEGFRSETELEADQFNTGLVVPDDYPAEQPANVARIDQVNDLEFDGYIADPENYARECFKLLTPNRTDFGLTQAIQVGVYDLFLQTNPGSPGKLGIKVVEPIRNRPVAYRMIDNANAHEFPENEDDPRYDFPWSEDKDEMFQRIYEITIRDGRKGMYYPARFEIWFYPEQGAPRKLEEKTYLIEGWNS